MDFIEKLFEETELLVESTETIERVIAEMMKYYKAIPRPSGPTEIRSASTYLKNTGEYKLYQFLQNCKFLEVPSDANPPNWYKTAGVTQPVNGKILFLYDAKFVTSCVKFYNKDKKVDKKTYSDLVKKGTSDDDLRIDQSELLFLIAHEALHIYRFHGLRARKKNLNPQTHNTAADSVINYQLENDIKVIGRDNIKMIENGIMIPEDKFMAWAAKNPKYKGKDFRQLLNSEVTYEYYKENPLQPPPPSPPTVIKKGDLVHIKKGKNRGKYIKVTSVKGGKIKGDIVSIKDEKEKFKAGNEKSVGGVRFFEKTPEIKKRESTSSKYSKGELTL